MEIRQLYYVLEIVKEGNYSKAAKSLYTTQSNISQQIRALEEEIQTTLFVRNTHSVQLTAEGRRFYALAKQTIESFEQLKKEFLEAPEEEKVYINVAAFDFFEKTGANVVTEFYKEHKNIVGGFRTVDAYTAYNLMDNRDIDFSIIKLFGDEKLSDKYTYVLLKDEYMQVLHAKENPLQQKESVSLKELCEQPLIIGNSNSFVYIGAKRLFNTAGLPFNVTFMSDNSDIVKAYIVENEAITLGSSSIAEGLRPEGVYSTPLEPPVKMSIYLAYPAGRKLTDTDRALIAHIVDGFKQHTVKK
ncbi:MAG: LysR family transcriptional regulator [Lachnospiraceae bacterium]|nr:LysR family transcriptional regulator [Lachnospiraceae bacterium]